MNLKTLLACVAVAAVLTFSGNAMAAEKANLNTATLSELSADPNIGPDLAAKIVEFRENVGDFTKYEDLKEIEGVASFDCNC